MMKMMVINLSKEEWIRRCKIRVMQRSKANEGVALSVAEECYNFIKESGDLPVIPPEQAADEEMSEWEDDEPN